MANRKNHFISRFTLLFVIAGLTCFGVCTAQSRTVRPVTPVTARPQPPVKVKKEKEPKSEKQERPASVVEVTDDLGNNIFLDTISGNEWVDSMALSQPKAVGNIYPLFDAVNIGVDVWPAINRAFGEKQGIGGIWGRLSLHNRYFIVLEAGVSNALSRPEEMNYTYKSPVCPYFKVGMDYNFFYNSNPDYQVYALARYGFSRVRYSLFDIDLSNGYWDTHEHISIPSQTSLSGYIQIGAGIHVKIWGPLAVGWSIRYQRVVHHSAEKYGAPWNMPGMGRRNSELGISLSLIYTIPLHPPIDTSTDKDKKK